MADSNESRRENDEEEAAEGVADVVSLAIGSMCHSFDIDVVTPLCSMDVSCSRGERGSAVEKVVVCQVGAPRPDQRPLDGDHSQGRDTLEHVMQFNSSSADGTASSTVPSAEVVARRVQDVMISVTEDEQRGREACNLQKNRVRITTGVQETEAPLDLSRNTERKTLRRESESEDDEPHMAGPLASARSTATSPLNVTSHMEDKLLMTETNVPHDASSCATEANSLSVTGRDHTYGNTRRDTVTTDYHMAGPNASARSTVTSPLNVTSHMTDGLVTTDSSTSKRSRVTSFRLSVSEDEDECCGHNCSDDEGPLDLSPKDKKCCGHAETQHCGNNRSSVSTSCSLDKPTADAAVGSSNVTSLCDNFESVYLQDSSPPMTSGKKVTGTEPTDTASTTCGSTLRLDMLPGEVLSHICLFLESRFVVTTMSCVCKTLYALIASRAFWKGRLYRRWQNKFPAIPVDVNKFDWREACVDCETFLSRWSDYEDTMAHLKFTRSVFASVDAVHLMHDAHFLVAGSRDRYLNVFDLSSIDLNRPETVNESLVFSKMNAHQGWIWSLSSVDNVLATGSWDMMVKFWDLYAGQCVKFVRCQSALLCSHLEAGFYVAGAFNWRMYHIDPRLASIVAVKKYHTHPVLCLAVDDRYIISGSEDRTVCVYDRRADGLVKTLTLDSYPMCMSYSGNQLWLGDKTGQVHLVDATHGRFDLVKTYDVGHTGKLTGIKHTKAGVFTCCTDKTIKVLEPTSQLDTICTIVSDNCAVARIDYNNGVLASANSDMSIGVLLPRRRLTS